MNKVLKSVLFNAFAVVCYLEMPLIFGNNSVTLFLLALISCAGIAINIDDGLSRKRITKRNHYYLNGVFFGIFSHIIVLYYCTSLTTEIAIFSTILFIISSIMNNNYRIAMTEKIAKRKNKNR